MNQLELDKTVLTAFRSDLQNLPRPQVKSIEIAVIVSLVNGELARIDKFIEAELKKL